MRLCLLLLDSSFLMETPLTSSIFTMTCLYQMKSKKHLAQPEEFNCELDVFQLVSKEKKFAFKTHVSGLKLYAA